jgi:hypothetical protein
MAVVRSDIMRVRGQSEKESCTGVMVRDYTNTQGGLQAVMPGRPPSFAPIEVQGLIRHSATPLDAACTTHPRFEACKGRSRGSGLPLSYPF